MERQSRKREEELEEELSQSRQREQELNKKYETLKREHSLLVTDEDESEQKEERIAELESQLAAAQKQIDELTV